MTNDELKIHQHNCFILHWAYCDGSASGVFPYVFTKQEAKVVRGILDQHGDDLKEFHWVEVPQSKLGPFTFKDVHSIEDVVK